MTDKKSAEAGRTIHEAEKTKKLSSSSKDAVVRRRINIRMAQNVLLIWLDNSIDKNNEDYQRTITQLRRVVNFVNLFTDTDQCIDFLTDTDNERVFMIISDALCEDTVPKIHDVAQLHTIFILSQNEGNHEQLVKKWSKIKGAFTKIEPICEALKRQTKRCEQNAIPISFMATNRDLSNKNLDELDSSFMYTQILKEILLTIEFEENHIKDFINYCHAMSADNGGELNHLKELEREYHDKTPIWWYTCECFLYSMLNRALRLMDVDLIIKMGFFIHDLHQHIKRLHSEQFSGQSSGDVFTVYRGQGLSKTDFDQMIKTQGGLMSFNSFLSTSKDRNVSFAFADSNQCNPDLVGILFVMTIDPSISSTPFASIN
jgi:hypothetical protein